MQAAADQKTILNRVGAASYFTSELDMPAERLGYRGASAASHARAMLDDIGNLLGWESYKLFIDATVKRLDGTFPLRDTIMVSSRVAYTGSAAAERIAVPDTLFGAYRAIDMGDGDDLVLLLETKLNTGALLDGGSGIDTLAMDAYAANVLAGAQQASLLRQFERLDLIDSSYRTVKVDGLGAFAHVSLLRESDGVIRGTRLEGVASGATVSADGVLDGLSVQVSGAETGPNDVLSLAWTVRQAAQLSTVTVDHVETIHLDVALPAPTKPFENSFVKLNAAHATGVTLAGDGPVEVWLATPALTSFDASAYRGTLELSVPGQAAATVIKGGAGDNYIGLSQATQSVEYLGGAGRDYVSGGAGTSTIRTGAGNDSVALDLGNSTVDLGAGDDEFVVQRGGASVVTGGAGTDAFYLNSATSSSKYTIVSITDLSAGETIRFMGYGGFVAKDRIGAALSLDGSPTFDQYLDAAAAGGTRGTLHWFVLGNETFVVADLSSAATFIPGGDMVVKLSGVHDLSASSFSGEGLFRMLAA